MSCEGDDTSPFGTAERLQLHQLRLLEWLDAQGKRTVEDGHGSEAVDTSGSVPDKWCLTRGVNLYDWQNDCIDRWFGEKHRGTVKVVTGAGKTILAMALTERLQNQIVPNLRVAVVVPTIVLMNQWYEELIARGNLPHSAIGRLGGGYKEDFSTGCRVLVAVLTSAHRLLPGMVREAGIGRQLLLIADECHRSGAAKMSQIFDTEQAFSLGLSATPEREDDEPNEEDQGYDGSLLGQALGPIIYDFNLAEALRRGIVPAFTIHHYGLPLNQEERMRYDRLSRAISDSQQNLKSIAPGEMSSGPGFFQWVQTMSTRGSDEIRSLASKFVGDTNKRKELIRSISGRGDAVEHLLKKEFQFNPEAQAILFHESIDEVMGLFVRLRAAGIPAIAEHSKLPKSIRENGLELFRKNVAKVIVSARSLIEGFNVPAVDIGIIVASSTSVRQRIQSLGRVLRRHRSPDGEEKTSSIHVLYARKTVDEGIYSKMDWNKTTGIKRNFYYLWDPGLEPQVQEGPPRKPLPKETEVDDTALEQDCVYPGEYEGMELSCDTQGNVFDAQRRFAINLEHLPKKIIDIKGSAGKFRITPKKMFVLAIVAEHDGWSTKFVTRLSEPPRFQTVSDARDPVDSAQLIEWGKTAVTGATYPSQTVPEAIDNFRYRKKNGGVISKQVRGGESYARMGNRAQDPECGSDASRLVKAVQDLHANGKQITQLVLNEINHVLYRSEGKIFFVCSLEKGLEFPG